jgi:hypothetical protein
MMTGWLRASGNDDRLASDAAICCAAGQPVMRVVFIVC